jgi:beta-lactamase superfamily II metal-dependent hydrolase
VLRVGRHVDGRAATPPLLTALAPQFAIISVDANNRSGVPGDDTITRLRENGSIRLTTDGAQVWIETEK